MRAPAATLALGLAGLFASPPPGVCGQPDAALYQEAKRARATLASSPRLLAQRAEWEKVILRYRKVVARYPKSGYCDDSLLAVGDLYRQMAVKFGKPRYNDDAVQAYKALVAEYPSSGLGEKALYWTVQIGLASGDGRRLAEAGKAYLAAYPDADRAPEVKALLRRKAPAQAAALPSPPPRGLTQVFDLRAWSGESSTRVVIDLEKKVQIRYERIGGPERLWVDLLGARLHPNLTHRSFPVGDGLLEQIRVGQNKDDVVRVVLDFRSVESHSVFYLEDPTRLVVDVRGTARASPQEASAAKASSSPARAEAAAPESPAPEPPGRAPEASPRPAEAPASSAAPEGIQRLPSRRLPALLAAWPSSSPSPSPPPKIVLGTEPSRRGPVPPPPVPPEVNRAGNYSLARQLGLGARRIVIDPGHGGHDPGTIGRGGLQEKDLVLDVALRLEKLVKAELGAEVLMTRSTDAFMPLEERTAIANSRGADLFLSIHANSSRSPQARGIETYFLNFAVDPHAEAVAARENAISAATLKDLQGLVKAIALNSKIDESRDFAAAVQEAMVEQVRPHYPAVEDRGVHTAPFYVLIGANMPSVLAEIAFVSHPEEEKLLQTAAFRDVIARSLLKGVRRYVEALNRTQTRQLTGTFRRSTVAEREGGR